MASPPQLHTEKFYKANVKSEGGIRSKSFELPLIPPY
jgi:hypothetical protein